MVSLDAIFGRGLEDIEDFPPPTTTAVVYKNTDRNTVIAKVWDEKHEKWKRVAQGKAGVDDASVIQSAVDSTEKGIIYLANDFTLKMIGEEPDYYNSYGVHLNYALQLKNKNGIIIDGGGHTLTLADNQVADASNLWLMTHIYNCKNLTLRNIIFDGNRLNQTENHVDGQAIILTSGANENLTFENTQFLNPMHTGVYVGNNLGGYSRNVTFKNIYAYNAPSVGVVLDNVLRAKGTNLTFVDCYKGILYIGAYNDTEFNSVLSNIVFKTIDLTTATGAIEVNFAKAVAFNNIIVDASSY